MYAEATVVLNTLLSNMTNAITSPMGESAPSPEVSVIVGTGKNAVQLNLPTLSGGLIPSGWRIYRGTASGSEQLIATVAGDQTVFYDDGTYTAGTATPPASATGQMANLPGTAPAFTATALSSAWLGQSFTANNGVQNIGYDVPVSQPFVPNNSQLSAIDLALDIHGAPTGNLVVSIYNTTWNNPTANTVHNVPLTMGNTTPIATVNIPIANIAKFQTTGNFTRATFASPANLSPGTLYHIVLSLDTAANTVASGNFATIAGQTGGSLTQMTTTLDYYFTGSTSSITASGAWALSSAHNALDFKTYSTGSLAQGTYYYKVTAVTGWVSKFTLSRLNSSGSSPTNILFSSGATNVENMYVAIGQSPASYSTVGLALIEYFDLNTHFYTDHQGNVFTNGTAIIGTSKAYNMLTQTVVTNTTNQAGNTNATYRVHVFMDRLIISAQGDPASTTYIEQVQWIGRIVSLASNDVCYAISAGTANGTNNNIGFGQWNQLRDYNNAVNTSLQLLFPIAPNYGTTSDGSNSTAAYIKTADEFSYLNKYTNNYDGLQITVMDSNGIRGYIPGVLFYPSGIAPNIPNHNTFTVGSSTYKFYSNLNNNYMFCFEWYVLNTWNGQWTAITNTYYPSFTM